MKKFEVLYKVKAVINDTFIYLTNSETQSKWFTELVYSNNIFSAGKKVKHLLNYKHASKNKNIKTIVDIVEISST